MFPTARLACSLALFSLTPPAWAGILTVGPPGAGAQFDEIQPAIDAALGGDVILIQPGTYAGITVSKPLRILGDGTGSVRIVSTSETGALITSIAAGSEVVLSAVEVESTPSPLVTNHAIRIANCAGTVVLHDVLLGAGPDEIGVRAESCARVALLACQLLGSGAPGTAAVSCSSSVLWIADSEIVGTSPPDDFHVLQSGAHAVALEDSIVHVWRSVLRGGDGNDVIGKAFGTGSPGAGVFADGSAVNLYGGPVGEVRGGDGGQAPAFGLVFPGAPGVDLIDGSVALLQALLPIAGGFDGAGSVQQVPVRVDATSAATLDPTLFPTLASDSAETGLGAVFTLELAGNPLAVQVLFVAVRTGADLQLPGVLGIGFLDLALVHLLATSALDPAGSGSLPVLVPPSPSLVGRTLYIQSVEANGFQLAISNPSLVTITG